MQNNIPSSLKEAFSKKKLIPIVGAGVSMSLKSTNGDKLFPSWIELLCNAAKKLADEAKDKQALAVKAMVDIERYEQAADIVRGSLIGKLWSDFFYEEFNVKSNDIDADSLALPRAIWKISNQVITLNYDRVLRLTCPEPTVTELDNNNTGALATFNRNDRGDYMVWHLHGHIDNANEIIFTSESYNKLYREKNPKYGAALTVFQTLCREKSLVFIGCSLEDADLLKQMSDQHDLFAGNAGPHYALVRAENEVSIKEKLGGLPIVAVAFSDFGAPLIELIDEITSQPKDGLQTTSASTVLLSTQNIISKQSNVKIAILYAKPIDKDYSYDELLQEFKKLKAEITLQHLSINALNNLEGFDYIFVFSKLSRTKVAIEDEMLNSRWISLKELEDNIGNTSTKGLFICLDHQNEADLDSTDISALTTPTLIFPTLNKSQIESFSFKIFKKRIFNYVDNVVGCNLEHFKISELIYKSIIIHTNSKLPANIDPRTTKHYVGRRTDLENLCRKIISLRGSGELLTLKGSGGIGKTITVKKLMVDFAERGMFSDGINFVDCEFIASYKAFSDHITHCFNVDNALDVEDAISSTYENQDRLIILDNMETLLHIDECESIKQLLSFISKYALVLATTRELIGLEHEQTYDLRQLTTDEAYDLFTQELPWRSEISEQDKRIIRENILESLLGNNPLAIKLITKNIPNGKKFADLKSELETNFFQKVSEQELEVFDSASDNNIERKKSLYSSINFSYQYLNENEKVAFELLSLFPDGINLENFKRLSSAGQHSNKLKQKQAIERLLITDPLIKALENKSLIQVDNHEIRLQSIVGKFAEHQFQQRSEKELQRYYKNAFNYNCSFVDGLNHHRILMPRQVAKIFHNHQNNFIKSIRYLSGFEFDNKILLEYIDDLSILAILIDSNRFLIQALQEQSFSFDNEAEKLFYDITMISLKYYAGDFSVAYEELKCRLPLQAISSLNYSANIEKYTLRSALDIYVMEGEVLYAIKNNKVRKAISRVYPPEVFQLGYFNKRLLSKSVIDFFGLEVMYSLNLLNQEAIDAYLKENVYEKSHLELMQTHYIKAKIGLITMELIKPLVVVNPYTMGLKQMMFAFVETDYSSKQAHFERALENLVHIRYYYVEALYFYAKFLMENHEKEKFNEIYQLGIDLARKHHYRFLIHKFEQLIVEVPSEYDVCKYPLDEDKDIQEYVDLHIKR